MAKADIAGGFTGVRSALGDVERGKSLLAGLDLVVSSTLALDAIHDGEW